MAHVLLITFGHLESVKILIETFRKHLRTLSLKVKNSKFNLKKSLKFWIRSCKLDMDHVPLFMNKADIYLDK